MPWIETIDPNDATGPLAELYEAISHQRNGVAEVHRITSLNLRAMKAHLEIYKSIVLARSTLSRVRRERLAVAVSVANACAYCVAHHAAALRNLGDDESVVAALERGVDLDGVSEVENFDAADRALVQWARNSTLRPGESSPDDPERLRAQGLDDRAILDATLTISYFNFVNRLVLMTGVALESDFERTCAEPPDHSEQSQ